MIVETLGIIGGIMGAASLLVAARQGSLKTEIDNLRARVVELERHLEAAEKRAHELEAHAHEMQNQWRVAQEQLELLRDRRLQALEERERLQRTACGKLDCPQRTPPHGMD